MIVLALTVDCVSNRCQLRHTDSIHRPHSFGATRGRHTERRRCAALAHYGQHEDPNIPRAHETDQMFEHKQNPTVIGHRFRGPQCSGVGSKYIRFGSEIHVSHELTSSRSSAILVCCVSVYRSGFVLFFRK